MKSVPLCHLPDLSGGIDRHSGRVNVRTRPALRIPMSEQDIGIAHAALVGAVRFWYERRY